MTELRTHLSSAELQNISFSQSDNDFEFVVGGAHLHCNHFLAEFLAPTISKTRRLDPTLSRYSVTSVTDVDLLKSFLSIGEGVPIVANSSNRSFFSSLTHELGNFELFWLIESHFSPQLSFENAVSRVIEKKLFDADFSDEVPFLASHFRELDGPSVKDLTLWDLDAILSRDSLRIKNENSLFDFIISCGFADYFPLFNYVRFKFLSLDRVRQFKTALKECDIALTPMIGSHLLDRLVLPVDLSNVTYNIPRYRGRLFVPSSSDPLDGIITHLMRACGANVHDKHIVNITGSTTAGGAAKNAADLHTASDFCTEDRPDQWLLRFQVDEDPANPLHHPIALWRLCQILQPQDVDD
jgi:hypothetical protein